MQKFIQDNLQYLIDVRNKNRKTNIDNYLDDYLNKNKVFIQDYNTLQHNYQNQNFLNF